MKEIYIPLHLDMLTEIDCCMEEVVPEITRAEICFWIARNYRTKLKEMVLQKDFQDEIEEIDFFRNVKPKFVCYIEFYAKLSEALLLISHETDRAIALWKEEGKRFDRFCIDNRSFVTYYESGDNTCDATYFLRENNSLKTVPTATIYDADFDFCTSHDRLVRDYLAYKMYRMYVNDKLVALAGISL